MNFSNTFNTNNNSVHAVNMKKSSPESTEHTLPFTPNKTKAQTTC